MTMKQMIKDSAKWSVEVSYNDKIIIKTMKGFTSGADARELFNTVHSCYDKNGIAKVLSDNKELVVWRDEDVKFINDDYLPRMIKSGWKYWGIVQPKNAVGRLAMQNFINFYKEHGVEVQEYNDYHSAYNWLKSK